MDIPLLTKAAAEIVPALLAEASIQSSTAEIVLRMDYT